MSEPYSNVGKVVRSLVTGQWYSAIKYVSPTKVIKATRRGRHNNRSKHDEFVVSIGKPNYAERIFVKQALAANEPFPIKKVQLI